MYLLHINCCLFTIYDKDQRRTENRKYCTWKSIHSKQQLSKTNLNVSLSRFLNGDIFDHDCLLNDPKTLLRCQGFLQFFFKSITLKLSACRKAHSCNGEQMTNDLAKINACCMKQVPNQLAGRYQHFGHSHCLHLENCLKFCFICLTSPYVLHVLPIPCLFI